MKTKPLVGISLAIFIITIATTIGVARVYRANTQVQRSRLVASLSNNLQVTPIKLTVEEVAKHSTVTDCWMIIDHKVYDFTSFMIQHPGGASAMIPYCGRDGSVAFTTKDKKPGNDHSQNARSMLATYFKGNLGDDLNALKDIAGNLPNNKGNSITIPNSVNAAGSTLQTGAGSSGTAANASSTVVLSAGEVANHNTLQNCWLIISGKVYNVTTYIASHPGGANAIAPYCGKDGTSAFQTKGGAGNNHSSSAYGLLNNYYIGNLGSSIDVAASAASGSGTGAGSTTGGTTGSTTGGSTSGTGGSNTGGGTGSSNIVLTMQEISTHNSLQNCWLIISGKVYNVTSYIVNHPGGANAIAPYCGKDGTTAFQTKGGAGNNHSNSAYGLLAQYLIGTVGASVPVIPQPTSVPAPTGSGGGRTPTATPVPSQNNPTPTPPPTTNLTLSPQEISTHNSLQNCWLIISNNVYNVTSYLSRHPPGPSVIAPYCGKEATTAFQTKGGNGSNHSSNARNLLAGYLIGTVGSSVPVGPPSPSPTSAPSATNTPVPQRNPTNTPAPQNNPTNTPVPASKQLPASVAAKYPGATIKSQSIESDGSQELEILYNGACRHIKTNSSGAITSDQSC